MVLLLRAVVSSLTACTVAPGEFNVTINRAAYLYGLQPWFRESNTNMTPAAGSLKLLGVKQGPGQDGFGQYVRAKFEVCNVAWFR